MASIPLSDQTAIAVGDICTERFRQLTVEGWTREHDDQEHGRGELARAAACYAGAAARRVCGPGADLRHAPADWPWALAWWKPGDARRMLVKAGALIVAAIEQIDRQSARCTPVRRVTDPHADTITVEISFPQGLTHEGGQLIDGLAQPPLDLDAYDSAVAEELEVMLATRARAYARALAGEELSWFEAQVCCAWHAAFPLECPPFFPDMLERRGILFDRYVLKREIARAIAQRGAAAGKRPPTPPPSRRA